MIIAEALFAYFAATKKDWGWYVVFPLLSDFICVTLLIIGSYKLVYAIGYLVSLLTLGIMLTFNKQQIFFKN